MFTPMILPIFSLLKSFKKTPYQTIFENLPMKSHQIYGKSRWNPNIPQVELTLWNRAEAARGVLEVGKLAPTGLTWA